MDEIVKIIHKAAMLVLLTCSMIAFTAAPVNPDNQAAVSQKLAVGVIEMPPFVMKAQNGPWQGISMNLLEAIAKELNLTLEIREYDSGNKLKEALLAEEIHLVPAVGMSENLEKIINFSNPYRLSGLAIAVNTRDNPRTWMQILLDLFSLHFIKVAPLLLMIWIAAGTLVWIFERRKNANVFGDGLAKGIGHGIWQPTSRAAQSGTAPGYRQK